MNKTTWEPTFITRNNFLIIYLSIDHFCILPDNQKYPKCLLHPFDGTDFSLSTCEDVKMVCSRSEECGDQQWLVQLSHFWEVSDIEMLRVSAAAGGSWWHLAGEVLQCHVKCQHWHWHCISLPKTWHFCKPLQHGTIKPFLIISGCSMFIFWFNQNIVTSPVVYNNCQ